MNLRKILLPFSIIPSSLTFFGWSIFSIFVMPFVLVQLAKLNFKIPFITKYSNFVFFYFAYMVFQSLIGILYLGDLRILFWSFFL